MEHVFDLRTYDPTTLSCARSLSSYTDTKSYYQLAVKKPAHDNYRLCTLLLLCIFVAFISHSVSMSKIKYLYQFLLPDLRGKVLLDIGSRLGAILYGVRVK